MRYSYGTDRGFTLVEALIYIAIFVFISVGSIGLVMASQELLSQYLVRQNLFVSGTTIMERVLVEVREADDVVVSGSAFATTTGALALATASGTIQFTYDPVESHLLLTESDGRSVSLHADNVAVTEFVVDRYTHDTSTLLRIRVGLLAGRQAYEETYTLRGGAIIRGSYE